MHRFANPVRFLRIARPLTAWFGWVGALLIAGGLVGGLFVTPADYLQGEAKLPEIIRKSQNDDFFFIPAGNHVTHPAELISNGRFKELLEGLSPMFDWVIVDSPPILPVSDGSVLAGMCDGVLLVVRAGSTPSEAAQRACHELKAAQIVGVVLNTVEQDAGSYGYGHYGQHSSSASHK